MKPCVDKLFATTILILIASIIHAQNVGIGTIAPTHELSVAGSIVVDHDSSNYGSLYNPSLLFGASGLAGISSSYSPFGDDYHGLSFWTSGYQRLTINQNGNVGIGMINPVYKLDVTGGIRGSYMNASGNISSGNNLLADNWVYADVGIRAGGGTYSNSYKFQINNGDSYFDGDGTFNGALTSVGVLTTESNLVTEGNSYTYGLGQVGGSLTVAGPTYANGDLRVYDNMAIGGSVDDNYRLRVWDGNARIGGDFHATGNAAIGGSVDPAWRLRVYGGDSRFGGDVQVTGTINTADLDVGGNFTINGTGSVRSNGPSPLKISFESKSINAYVNGGGVLDQTVNLPAFDAAGDIRVMIAQFVPLPGDAGNYWDRMTFQPHEVDPTLNTCVISIQNPSSGSWIKGTLYYMVVLKDN